MDGEKGYPVFTPFGEKIIVDTSRTWVDPNGYRLSDRLWKAKDRDRATIDFILQAGARAGKPVLDTAKELEEFLTPEGRSSKTRQPTGRGTGNASARRLARTETSRAFNQASIDAARENPFVRGLKWNLSGTHRDQDQCDVNASDSTSAPGWGPGEYRFDDFPRIPNHPHCRCYVTSVQGDVDHVIDILHSDLAPSDFNQQLAAAVEPPPPPKPTAPPWVQKIKELQEAKRTFKGTGLGGYLSESQVRTAGKLVRQEMMRRRPEADEALGKLIRGLEEELLNANRKINQVGLADKAAAVRERDEIAARFRAALNSTQRNIDEVVSVLSEVREMGTDAVHTFTAMSHPDAVEAVNSLSKVLPKDWIEASVRYGDLDSNVIDRAYYSGVNARIGERARFASQLHVSGDAEYRANVAIHEFGHRMQHINTSVRDVEIRFYTRRTKGDKLVQIYPGNKEELARPDKFGDLYIGKQYSDRTSEVTTMGLQDLYGKRKFIENDPEMMDLILGMLAVL